MTKKSFTDWAVASLKKWNCFSIVAKFPLLSSLDLLVRCTQFALLWQIFSQVTLWTTWNWQLYLSWRSWGTHTANVVFRESIEVSLLLSHKALILFGQLIGNIPNCRHGHFNPFSTTWEELWWKHSTLCALTPFLQLGDAPHSSTMWRLVQLPQLKRKSLSDPSFLLVLF